MTYYSTRQLEQVYFDSFSLQTLHWARAFGAMGDGLQGSPRMFTTVTLKLDRLYHYGNIDLLP